MISHTPEPDHATDGFRLEPWDLVLFVVAGDPLGERAHRSLTELCDAHLPQGYRIDIVDIVASPEQADAFDVVAVPTVIRRLPEPVRRVIGDLSVARDVMAGLGMPTGVSPSP
jgi:circadian clock protein KaiB